MFLQGMHKTAEEIALTPRSEVDTRVFMWTFDCLDEDHELERFFSGFPGIRSSKVVDDPLPSLTTEQKMKLGQAVTGLFNSTISYNLLPESVKNRRAIICAKALDPATFSFEYRQIFWRILFDDRYRGLQTAEFGRVMRDLGDGGDQETALAVQGICTNIVARAQRHDESWLFFASNKLGLSEAVLREYAAHGDNLSLAILIYVTHQQFNHFQEGFGLTVTFSDVLQAASKFNV